MSRDYFMCDPQVQEEGEDISSSGRLCFRHCQYHNWTKNNSFVIVKDKVPFPRRDLPSGDPPATGLHWKWGKIPTFSQNLKLHLSADWFPAIQPYQNHCWLHFYCSHHRHFIWCHHHHQVDMNPSQKCTSQCSCKCYLLSTNVDARYFSVQLCRVHKLLQRPLLRQAATM